MLSIPKLRAATPAAPRNIGRSIISEQEDTRIDLKLLKGLVRLMKGGDVNELEIDDSDKGLRIRLKRGAGASDGAAPTVQLLGGAPAYAPAPGEAAAPISSEGTIDEEPESDAKVIKSPMVGTFYRTPSPDSDPFVRIGDHVEETTVVCILEAMKVMNEIQAELGGEIAEVLVENGEPVEFGQPLFLLR
jgi:acetyl-CoA carboxylase biotin carboxyl carrier protein